VDRQTNRVGLNVPFNTL